MATIRPKGNGYEITVSMGYDLQGRQRREYMTWVPRPGMTERQIQKELDRQAVLFEERCKSLQVTGGNIKLADYLNLWLQNYAERHLKQRTVHGYRCLAIRVNEALGHIRLGKLGPRHLIAFYAMLAEDGIRRDVRFAPKLDFKALLHNRGITQKALAIQAGLSIGTINALVAGRNLAKASVDKVCTVLSLDRVATFEPVTGEKLSGNTQLHYHRFLSSALETAVQWQYIAANPCDRVKAPRAEHKEALSMDQDDVIAYMKALETEPILFRAILTLALCMGPRRGELCALEWPDCDLDAGLLRITRNAVYVPGQGIIDDTPKTRSSIRTLRMPALCVEVMREYKAWQDAQRIGCGDAWRGSTRVFTTGDGGDLHPDTLSKWAHGFVRRHDLPPVTLHGLRHTNASLMIAAGTDVRTVAGRLGHAQTSTTTNIYAHLIQAADAAAAENIDDFLRTNGTQAERESRSKRERTK